MKLCGLLAAPINSHCTEADVCWFSSSAESVLYNVNVVVLLLMFKSTKTMFERRSCAQHSSNDWNCGFQLTAANPIPFNAVRVQVPVIDEVGVVPQPHTYTDKALCFRRRAKQQKVPRRRHEPTWAPSYCTAPETQHVSGILHCSAQTDTETYVE